MQDCLRNRYACLVLMFHAGDNGSCHGTELQFGKRLPEYMCIRYAESSRVQRRIFPLPLRFERFRLGNNILAQHFRQ